MNAQHRINKDIFVVLFACVNQGLNIFCFLLFEYLNWNEVVLIALLLRCKGTTKKGHTQTKASYNL